MFGTYRTGKEQLPRVLHISVARYRRGLPKRGESLRFLVSIHEEGTGITWQQNVTVDPESERFFLDTIQDLYLWSLNAALTPKGARDRLVELGRRLYEAFIGPDGKKILQSIVPTAVLLNVDETILNLPWELIGEEGDAVSQRTPFGRLVTTRVIPRPARDPLKEDQVVRILAIANPTLDLAAGEREIVALRELEGDRGGFKIEVSVLTRDKATRSAFSEKMATGDYDILHFSGHGSFDPSAPETSTIRFADGMLSADAILDLEWKAPPYLVFNSACESGRAAGGKRLVSGESQSNGLAAAFIAAGASGYAGYFWPVTETGASLFTKAFYKTLFQRENVGLAFLEARKYVVRELGEVADLTGYSAILFGDAASKHRRDLAMAV
jgi:CHAT domain-containing protein